MEEQLINNDTKVLAIEKGFVDIEQRIITAYTENGIEYEADDFGITQSLLQKWLRDVYHIEIHIDCVTQSNGVDKTTKKMYYQYMIKSSSNYYFITMNNRGFKTYEEALEEALQEALELI